MSFKKLIYFLILAFAILGITAEIYAVTYEPLPNWPNRRGFNYFIDMPEYSQLLLSSMPYKVMQGYIVADSIVRTAPRSRDFEDSLNKLNLKLTSDTVSYIFKYWYLLTEYNAYRFCAFLNKDTVNPVVSPKSVYSTLYSYLVNDPRMLYADASYILHVYVNETVKIDTMDTKFVKGNFSKIVAYCKVLDTLKGNILPNLTNAIFYNGETSSSSSGVNASMELINPQQTDLVFEYVEQWMRIFPNNSYLWGPPLFDSEGNPWIKPNREYIVFLDFLGQDETDTREYFNVHPVPYYCSYGMYPIENGSVLDEGNTLGFGEIVPVNVFKQGIRNKINEIKNYGE